MRNLFSALVLSLSLCPVSAWAAEESLLLNVHPNGLEAIAFCTPDGRFREVPNHEATEDQPMDPVVQQIVMGYFKPGSQLDVFYNGLSKGVFEVKSYEPPGCSGFGYVSGALSPKPDTDYVNYLGFSSGYPGQRSYSGGFAPDAALKTQALKLVQELYTQKGLKPEQLKRLQIDQLDGLIFSQGERAVMIASRIMSSGAAGTDSNPMGCHSHHLLLVAGQQGKQLVPRLELYKTDTQAEGECSGYSFLSSFRLTPQSDYLMLEGWGYEWNWYEIFKRRADGSFEQVFNGGGGGC